mgnify:CR=1 FL=1
MSITKNQFHAADWVVFIAVLCVSLGIGIFHAFTGGKQKSNSEYLVGNRNMKLVPVTLSILVSFLSSVLILGYPAEMYNQGTAMWFNAIGMSLGAVVAALLFVPLFHPLKLTSVNEVS